METLNAGDTAWLMVSCALVLLMIPGLALFYGGLVSRRNVLSTIMHSMVAIPILSIKWCLFGYTLAFGPSQGGWVGDFSFLGLNGVAGTLNGTVPTLCFAAFQMMFAVITPALISGAFAERMKFSAYIVFILVWSTLVYDPVAHWVWAEGGWLLERGALDFAGGTVVHLTAGISALVCAVMIGKRLGYPRRRSLPHNLTMTMLGTGLLLFGWFGFNAGSALAAGHVASVAFMATMLGAAGGAVGWVVIEWIHGGKPTALGVASGIVAGLVAITPAAGFVAPWAAIVIGAVSGAICYSAVLAKNRFGYDDSLDAFGIHGVGGLAGALLTGVFAQIAVNPGGADGLLFGNPELLLLQGEAVLATGVYATILTIVILKGIDMTIGLRVSENQEREGLDSALHGEAGYIDTQMGTPSYEGSMVSDAAAPVPVGEASPGVGL